MGGKVDGNPAADNAVAPRNTCGRLVEVSVYDKQSNEVRVFRCDMQLLESSMAYFAPIIKCYLDEEERQRARDEDLSENSTSGTLRGVKDTGGAAKQNGNQEKPPVPLHVNCDMNTFSWLMAYVEGQQRSFTPKNAVSLALSSNFLLMMQLVEMTLLYIKDHLVEVMLSGVNMDCFTGELLARLANMMSEGDVASAFLKLYDWHAEDTPNRRFLTALIRHMLCDRFGEGRRSSLRWCGLCGVLFDQQELQRVERRYKHVKLPACPNVAKNSIGHRGELIKTHVASKRVANINFPLLSWSDKEVEAWAWGLVGSLYLFVCRRCNCCIPLSATTTHSCPGGTSNFTRAEATSREDTDALLAWFELARKLYPSGLKPIYCPKEDVVHEPFLLLSPSGEWLCDDAGDSSVPGLWATHPVAVAESVDARGKVNIGVVNGFERWLMEEMQQMMEDFDQSNPGGRPYANYQRVVTSLGNSATPSSSVSRALAGGAPADGPRPKSALRGGRSVDSRIRPLSNGNDMSRKGKEGLPSGGNPQRRDRVDSNTKALS
uniref:Uncharacterized protein TCIL3000_11_9720 n=1 Tax=Trypanosoma congolense (strain IL3000) TaxID=1068625 RepID=G0V1I4_TRYCI|nr:unnamed protein product [Trypanosoma congolense IL3000]